jgi:hypothetical protein
MFVCLSQRYFITNLKKKNGTVALKKLKMFNCFRSMDDSQLITISIGDLNIHVMNEPLATSIFIIVQTPVVKAKIF